jgi:primosomal protein N' (replication factor Y)
MTAQARTKDGSSRRSRAESTRSTQLDLSLTVARVVPLVNARAVQGLFDYSLAGWEEVSVGSLLRVRFGGRGELALVADLAPASQLPAERLASPEEVLEASLPAPLVALGRWMAREYCSTPARCLSLMLPARGRLRRSQRVRLFAQLTAAGRAAVAGEKAGGQGQRPLTAGQRALLQTLAREGQVAAAALGGQALRRLQRRGLVAIEPRADLGPGAGCTVGRAAGAASTAAPAAAPRLTAQQSAALAAVIDALDAREHRRLLLHGVTGSGKTEVYLQAVARVLQMARSAIVLVPEIALTPQAEGRFRDRLGDVVALIHSGQGEAQRAREWWRLREGRARVCVGPRSAVFAPLENLGLVVIDEEHEGSYKHEGDPRYDAREVALMRARIEGAVLLEGSATPRSETFHRARRLRMAARVDGRALPSVEILDMRERPGPFHPEARAALAALARRPAKGIVLLNRRGWSNFLSCRSCGRVWMCPNCEVALVMHRAQGMVRCHHCGHRAPVPRCCPDCGSVSVARHGAGTERIEHELRAALGGEGFPVLRLDADATPAQRERTLESFARADAGLLVGTQIVAKGHDFPDVELGIVLDADQTLRFPDFRAEERTFALITQFAGRTGRAGAQGGRVLVQTLAPRARAIRLAARHDADAFLDGELQRRLALGYPPFSTLIRVVCAAPESATTLAAASVLRAAIDPPGAVVLGPAPLFALRGRARAQLLVKARDRNAAIDAVAAAVERYAASRPPRELTLSVDVDPQ